jgi:hypothetical protein
MSDLYASPIGPVPPVGGVPAPRPVGRQAPSAGRKNVAATTGGALKAAYAQLVIDPDTHDVLIRILDAETHAVIREYPSSEVEHMAKDLKDYVDALERRQAADRRAKS